MTKAKEKKLDMLYTKLEEAQQERNSLDAQIEDNEADIRYFNRRILEVESS